MLIPGNKLGDTINTCYIGIFKSSEIKQDTWYIGNVVMKDYYAVFDLTPADDEAGGKADFIQFGIGMKLDGHGLEYQDGAEVNIFYDR